MKIESGKVYDVAISFAEEDRAIALCIYLALKLSNEKLNIYYYPTQFSSNSGKNLLEALPKIYGEQSKCVVLLVSKSYLQKKDPSLVKLEIKAIEEREKRSKNVFLIPVLIDDTELVDISKVYNKYTLHAKWNFEPEILADDILKIICIEKKQIVNELNKLQVFIGNVDNYFHKVETVIINNKQF